jgi:hypothetical protein
MQSKYAKIRHKEVIKPFDENEDTTQGINTPKFQHGHLPKH